MEAIPGWASLTPVETVGERTPYPGSISDFDEAISTYSALVDDARHQLIRNRDAEALEKKHIRESEQYIARQNRMMIERTRKGLKIPPEVFGNIDREKDNIVEAQQVLERLPAHRAEWLPELNHRKALLRQLRDERRKGLGKNNEPRRCGSRNTADGLPCDNPRHYRKGSGWGPCEIPGH
ncbi:MAG: hypothetical protein ACOH2J_15265 [Allorhizobium sp.]